MARDGQIKGEEEGKGTEGKCGYKGKEERGKVGGKG